MPLRFSLTEVIIVLVIIILVLGVGRIAQISSELGKTVKSFRQGLKDEDQTKETKDKPKDE